MKCKLTIHPCFDSAPDAYTSYKFETESELMAAKNACADLLLFLQDKLKVMDDESNVFICEEFVDGEWVEIEEDYDE